MSVVVAVVGIIVTAGVYVANRGRQTLATDSSWVYDLGYQEDEVHPLTFSWPGDRSVPQVPVTLGDKTVDLFFDTGCGVGIFLTNTLENQVRYTLLGTSEALNRDGSHRGWNKLIRLAEIEVFGATHNGVQTIMSDWRMYSSEKFNGAIGLAYFQDRVVTLDYVGRRIAIGSNPIDYAQLDQDKYIVLPLRRSTDPMQVHLPFFEAEYNSEPVIVYLDTGKNHSYIWNPESRGSIGAKPEKYSDVPIKIGSLELELKDMVEVGSIAQAEGLPFPTVIEMNSDQIWKNRLLVTLDLIDHKIIFRQL